jgi:hypothetical protein
MTNRYHVSIRLEKYREHRGVWLGLYHSTDSMPEGAYAEMIPAHLDRESPQLRQVAEGSFSAEEVEALRAFAARLPGATLHASPAGQVQEDDMAIHQVSLNTGDILELHNRDGWPLPCLIHAEYDLRHAGAGSYVNHPNLGQLRYYKGEDGSTVIKRPPF